jgi:hypothetical protein
MTKIGEDNLSELAWSSPGEGWECEADNVGGSAIYECLENVITRVDTYFYNRRITFKRDGELYQFTAQMGHEGRHEFGEPYKVEAFTETVTKYRKPDSGHQADRPVGRASLPARYAPPGGWAEDA